MENAGDAMKDEAADTDIDADANGLFILDDSNNKHPISIRTIASFYAHQPIIFASSQVAKLPM